MAVRGFSPHRPVGLKDLSIAFERFFKRSKGEGPRSGYPRFKKRGERDSAHVKGMQQNRHLALSIGDAGMGELRRQLAYKSQWYGSRLVIADRFYPSSKTCSGCGLIKNTLRLSERVFHCEACGLSLDRDENAPLNLRKLVLAELPEGLREVTPVGEEGSGSTPRRRVKPASVKQEASGSRPTGRPNTQRREERLAGVATSWT